MMSEATGDGGAGASEHPWHPAFRPNSIEEAEQHSASSQTAHEFTSSSNLPSTNEVAQEPEAGAGDQVGVDQDPNISGVAAAPIIAPIASQKEEHHEVAREALVQPEVQQDNLPPDELQAAWASEPAAPQLQHTNSFPAVPPFGEHDTDSISTILSQTQAAAVMAEAIGDEEASQTDPWGQSDGGFFDKSAQPQNELELGASDAVEPSDAEARYEEGLPLVPKEESAFGGEVAKVDADTEGEGFDAFGDEAAHDDFFSQVGSQSNGQSEPQPGHLPRKSTEQVLSAVDLSTATEQTSTRAEQLAPSDFSNITGGGIAVSTTTVVSQVLSEHLEEVKSGSGASNAVKEDDLSALWQAALGDDELLEDDGEIDPSSFFDDDGEGFLAEPALEEAISPPIPTPVHDSNGQLKGFSYPTTRQTSQQSLPSAVVPNSQPMTSYGHQNTQSMTAFPQYGRQAAIPTPNPTPATSGLQSFADKAKGGYTSPFDAPMDLSRPKRRTTQPIQTLASQQGLRNTAPPPPRVSSMAPPSTVNAAPPSSSSQPSSASYSSSTQGSGQRPQSKSSSSSFFEDLPIVSKGRPPSASARSPSINQPPLPPLDSNMQQSPPKPPPTSQDYGLVAPQREIAFGETAPQVPAQSPYAPQPQLQMSKTAPPVNTRYSPAPAAASQDAGARNRYAAPPQGGLPPRVPSISNVNQYLPRTSSPLMHSSSASQLQPSAATATPPSTVGPPHAPMNYAPAPSQTQFQHPPAPTLAQAFDPSSMDRPEIKQRGLADTVQAPFTSHGPQIIIPPQSTRNTTFYDERSFIVPNDGTEHDPLRRWQGAPILRFGFGGSIVTSFPKRVPRFTTSQATPAIKCAPGEVHINASKLLPLDDLITSFPGPLKAKGKKKDVLAWLSSGISRLEEEMSRGGSVPQSESSKRRVENLLLWKVLRAFVEYDGSIDGNAAAAAAIRVILTPEVQEAPLDGNLSNYYQSPAILSRVEQSSRAVASLGAVEEIRKLLLRGEREKAVWFAVDQKLWGHAMLIASTLPPELWKQVTQDFVKNEVKTAGENTESLAALYDVFSGNWEESMDQLVSSSTRAGLQMVSKTANTGPIKNALDGLDRWRETLGMVLSNRSAEDIRSLASLGHLLLSYGRTEAAHICYLFARIPGLVSGADDPNAAIVLIGENHKANPANYAQDLYSVLLTEVYEFGACVLASNPTPAFGHLQSFKLWHATMLAESGVSDQAQQYCDAIASTLKGSTKASPYYHAALFTGVDDLSNRIRSAPRDGSGSWISKPSMDKVSGSMWSKFSSFVAGDDSDAASATSKAEAEGPFAMISGSTPPSVSRGPSPSNPGGLYAGMNGYMPTAAKPISGNSRYAPKGQATSEPGSVNRQPSISSLGSASPDHNRSYMPQGQALPAQALSFSPAKETSPYAPHTGAGNTQRPSIPSFQHQSTLNSSRAVSDAGIPSPPSGVAANAAGSSHESQLSRSASPYEARPASYAPRASAYQPRSYQPSPKPAALDLSENTYQPTANAPEEEDLDLYLATPTASQVPPTPKASDVPSYGYQPQDSAHSAAETEEPGEPNFGMTEDDTQGGYQPQVASYEPSAPSYEQPQSSYEPPSSGYEPPSAYEPPSGGYEPPSGGYEPPSGGYEPSSGGYEPPTSGYAPPSASEEAIDANGTSSAPKKKGVMDLSDDEDDLAARAANLKKAQRAENDRKAAEAFRQAAEADAARGKSVAPKSSGWLGGWFSRKGEDGGSDSSGGGMDGPKKPIKARLGEESSFYYDAELKKWVNKKGGAEAAAPSAPTPPPPRGGPPPGSRATSMGPPMARPPTSNPSGTPPTGGPPPMGSGPPSRTSSPAVAGSEDVGAPPASGLVPGVAPPSRPGTGMSGMSNASSIDDLIGAAGPRRAGGSARKAKKKGYVDVMAK